MAELARNWTSRGNCVNGDTDPDEMFVAGAQQNIAKRVCRGCVVQYECLADALDNRIEYGVWGGKTERERRAMLRRYPGVPSWRRLFETATRQHEASGDVPVADQQAGVAPALGDAALDTVASPAAAPDDDRLA